MSEYKYVVDTQSKVVDARRAGIREGMQKGIQEGIQKGIQEGEQKKAIEFARKLKNRGVPAEHIAEDTGLTLHQIAEL
jgi:predicted transposase/invertase (TIGR01784 family)